MLREIVLDTETTGLDPFKGDRIVEIGCLELINHVATGKTFHVYINPERPMSEEAFNVHGLGDDFLKDKPKFSEVQKDFITFIEDSPLVIHNAKFDMKFLNFELKNDKKNQLNFSRAIDTLMIARHKFPGSPASLDALCKRFKIDNSNRQLHGALLDAELLSLVYLELIGGRQPGFLIDKDEKNNEEFSCLNKKQKEIRSPRPHSASKEEIIEHEKLINKINE